MNQQLFIDDKFIGYVKRYHQGIGHTNWIFVLDTIDTVNEKYQLQVQIDMASIKSFNSCGSLRIITKEDCHERNSEVCKGCRS